MKKSVLLKADSFTLVYKNNKNEVGLTKIAKRLRQAILYNLELCFDLLFKKPHLLL